jgi:hypothetical protein
MARVATCRWLSSKEVLARSTGFTVTTMDTGASHKVTFDERSTFTALAVGWLAIYAAIASVSLVMAMNASL